ncbi:harmonin isoform X2 [Neocloeon triangulifer]|uniref:harmonin isoform X2 n=1 Tax=Neocloeon triangulifer TaxID=2078957 RepID=UPI00286F90E5|nr:harmonin isoform X2 [Neocloeon triangulifer]
MVSNPLGTSASEHKEHTPMQVLQFKVVTLIDNKEEIDEFNDTIDKYMTNHKVVALVKGLKQIIKLPARLQLFDDVRRIVPLSQQMEYNLLVPYTSNRTRNVELQRRGPSYGFGFSIRGGREHGTGFFVSFVEANSEAFFQGLKIGDQIVRINGFSVEYAIHREVLQLIQSSTHLYLKVRSVGMIPVKDKKHDSLTWQMVEGQRSVSPTHSSGRTLTRTYSEGSILDRQIEETRDIKLYLDLTEHSSLGVSICKGTKQRPGIFIQSTRENSLAQEAGFLPGDQIIECNGSNFEDIEFKEAVKILKDSKHLDLVIRRGVVGMEFFGESSGYNSSSSSVNGDHHTDGSKRLSLITEDPEDGERSRSNSRRGPDEALTVVMEHPADTVDSKETLVRVLVHREADEEHHHTMNPLAQSSSGSSLSSFSSAVSLEAKRRAERREVDDNISISSDMRRPSRDVTIKALPAERREKHAQLMQEFQQVHKTMFSSNNTREFSTYQDRAESARKLSERNAAAANAATRQVMYLERRSSESVEMPSMDTLTLNRGSNGQIKPPAVYFGGKPGKSTPGVVTINEYPTDRRPSPNKLDFLPHTNGQHNGTHQHDDPQGALSSELHSTLSRSNRRQLSEPMPTPPPPPLSPHLQENHHEPPRQAKDQEREPVRVEVNGDSADARSRARTKLQAIHALARARSPPPVVAKKPIAIPYTELVNARNQLLFDDALRIQNYHDDVHSNSGVNQHPR